MTSTNRSQRPKTPLRKFRANDSSPARKYKSRLATPRNCVGLSHLTMTISRGWRGAGGRSLKAARKRPGGHVDAQRVEVEDFLGRVFVVAEFSATSSTFSQSASPGLAYGFMPRFASYMPGRSGHPYRNADRPRARRRTGTCRSRPCSHRPWSCGRCRRRIRTARHPGGRPGPGDRVRSSNFQIARCGLAAGDVAAVFPLTADRLALNSSVGLRTFRNSSLP